MFVLVFYDQIHDEWSPFHVKKYGPNWYKLCSFNTPIFDENFKYKTFILISRLILVLVYRAIKIESYYPNLVAKQFGLCQGPSSIFLQDNINSLLHCTGNAKVLYVLKILEIRLFLSFFNFFILIFFPASTVTFQLWWASIWEQNFIKKGIGKAISDFEIFF